MLAARAAACAASQGKFWEMHDKLIEEQRGENRGAFAQEHLVRFAEEVGVDPTQLTDCLQRESGLDSLQEEIDAGKNRGVRATPTVFVNGERVSYPMDYAYLHRMLERALKRGVG